MLPNEFSSFLKSFDTCSKSKQNISEDTSIFCGINYHNVVIECMHSKDKLGTEALLDFLSKMLEYGNRDQLTSENNTATSFFKLMQNNSLVESGSQIQHNMQTRNALQEANDVCLLHCCSDEPISLLQDEDGHKSTAACLTIYAEALWIACYTGNLDCVVSLVFFAEKCGIEYQIVGSNGWTPFLAAYSMGHTQVAKHLTESYFFGNVDESTRQENSALLLLIWNRENFGSTKLHLAVEKNDIAAVKRLVYILNVNEQDNLGRTALYLAACYGHTEIFQILYSAFADENIVNDKGETARDIAARNGHEDILNILDFKGQTCFQSNHGIIKKVNSQNIENATASNNIDTGLSCKDDRMNCSKSNRGFSINTTTTRPSYLRFFDYLISTSSVLIRYSTTNFSFIVQSLEKYNKIYTVSYGACTCRLQLKQNAN